MSDQIRHSRNTKNSRKGGTWRYCRDCHIRHTVSYVCHPSKLFYVKNGLDTIEAIYKRAAAADYKKFLKTEENKRHTTRKNCNKPSSTDTDIQIPIGKATKKDPQRTKSAECHICMEYKGYMLKLGCNHTMCKKCYINILNSDNLRDKCTLCRTDMFNENWENYLILGGNKSDPIRITNEDLSIPTPSHRCRYYSLIKTDVDDDIVVNTIR